MQLAWPITLRWACVPTSQSGGGASMPSSSRLSPTSPGSRETTAFLCAMSRANLPVPDPEASITAERALQCARPCPEARIEADRRLTGIADRALDFLEIPRCEIVALL